jgi:hypothetical protein
MKPLAIAWALALSVSNSHGVSLINLSFSGSMTATQQQTFVDAAAFWNSAITGYDLTTNIYGQYQPHTLTINASIPSLDGIGGTLGSAGPKTATYYDNNPYGTPTVALYYTTTGSMQFDSADVPALVANNTFYGVVLHEMAHVLGIGTLWALNSNLENTTYPIYTVGSGQYTGPNALAQYRSEFSQPSATYVPVELAGGSGTANAHWNEVDGGVSPTGIISVSNGMDLQDELMTGWASGNFFLSRTTLGSLDDLGYIVDYNKAGIVNHIVVVPELSSISLCLLGGALLFRRRR